MAGVVTGSPEPYGGPAVVPLMIDLSGMRVADRTPVRNTDNRGEQVSFPDTTPDCPFEPELATRLPVPTCWSAPQGAPLIALRLTA